MIKTCQEWSNKRFTLDYRRDVKFEVFRVYQNNTVMKGKWMMMMMMMMMMMNNFVNELTFH